MPTPDFGKAAADYATFRKPFPPELFDRLARFSIGAPGQLVLDLASGTGLLARELSLRGCRVIPLDPSLDLLKRGLKAGVIARAERLPFADNRFDAVVAAQCWHWFDRAQAPAEVLRILKPAGRVAIYQMYVPLPGSIAHLTESLILRFNPRWRHANSAGINGQVLRDFQSAGFTKIESFSFDVSHDFTSESWRGLIRTTSPIAPSLPPHQVEAFDAQLGQLLQNHPPSFPIPHRIFAAIAQKPI